MVVTLHQIAEMWRMWHQGGRFGPSDSQHQASETVAGGLASLWVAPGLRVHNKWPTRRLERVSLCTEAGAHNNIGKRSFEQAQ